MWYRFISSEVKLWAGAGRWPKPWRKMLMINVINIKTLAGKTKDIFDINKRSIDYAIIYVQGTLEEILDKGNVLP